MGTNKANPAAMILSSTMMLRHLGYAPHFNPPITSLTTLVTASSPLPTLLPNRLSTSSTSARFAQPTWAVSTRIAFSCIQPTEASSRIRDDERLYRGSYQGVVVIDFACIIALCPSLMQSCFPMIQMLDSSTTQHRPTSKLYDTSTFAWSPCAFFLRQMRWQRQKPRLQMRSSYRLRRFV